MTLLVVLEHDQGLWADANDQAMTAARQLAAVMEAEVHALLIGEAARHLAGQAAAGGADVVHIATDPVLTDFGPEAYGQTIAELLEIAHPAAIMAIGTDRGNEVMAQAAARANLPFASNCLAVEPTADQWSITRVQWGGSLIEAATLSANTKLLTYNHHAVPAEPGVTPGVGTVVEFSPQLDPDLARTVVVQRQAPAETGGATLTTANVVVSGGRGVGSADGFAIIEELAEVLGGRVGCSRAATNLGWRSHSDQVGQTGTRIAPEIYIACGISGAIQHWVGAMASKRILAINIDPEANMVLKADYAVVADLHDVVPAITAEIARRRTA